jgi:hypothetical protein
MDLERKVAGTAEFPDCRRRDLRQFSVLSRRSLVEVKRNCKSTALAADGSCPFERAFSLVAR